MATLLFTMMGSVIIYYYYYYYCADSKADYAQNKDKTGKVQTLDWTTGLEYWTDIFLVFAHVVVG